MYADLRRIGWDKADAFYVSFHHLYSGYAMREQNAIMKRLEADPNISRRIIGEKKDDERMTPAELARETSKEKIISDLLKARKRTREGTKEWADYTKMIADYTKIKQDDIKVDEQPIRYYLPVNYPTSCKDCLIYKNKERKKLERTK